MKVSSPLDIKYLSCLLFSIIVLCSSKASAVTYYVSLTGNNTNLGTTPATAFRTVQYALNTAIDGSTISIGAGKFKGILTLTAKTLTIQSTDSLNQAILESDSIGLPNQTAFTLDNAQNVVFKNLTFRIDEIRSYRAIYAKRNFDNLRIINVTVIAFGSVLPVNGQTLNNRDLEEYVAFDLDGRLATNTPSFIVKGCRVDGTFNPAFNTSQQALANGALFFAAVRVKKAKGTVGGVATGTQVLEGFIMPAGPEVNNFRALRAVVAETSGNLRVSNNAIIGGGVDIVQPQAQTIITVDSNTIKPTKGTEFYKTDYIAVRYNVQPNAQIFIRKNILLGVAGEEGNGAGIRVGGSQNVSVLNNTISAADTAAAFQAIAIDSKFEVTVMVNQPQYFKSTSVVVLGNTLNGASNPPLNNYNGIGITFEDGLSPFFPGDSSVKSFGALIIGGISATERNTFNGKFKFYGQTIAVNNKKFKYNVDMAGNRFRRADNSYISMQPSQQLNRADALYMESRLNHAIDEDSAGYLNIDSTHLALTRTGSDTVLQRAINIVSKKGTIFLSAGNYLTPATISKGSLYLDAPDLAVNLSQVNSYKDTLYLNGKFNFKTGLSLTSGNLQGFANTGQNTVTLDDGATLSEADSGYLIGTVTAYKVLSNAIWQGGGIGATINATGVNLFTTTITRTSGLGNGLVVGTKKGIDRIYRISTLFNPSDSLTISLKWNKQNDLIARNLDQIQVYRSGNLGVDWFKFRNPVAAPQRQVTFKTRQVGYFTFSDTANAVVINALPSDIAMQSVRVAPNPVSDAGVVLTGLSAGAIIMVTDVMGRNVNALFGFSATGFTANSDVQFLPTSGLPSGMYLIAINGNNKKAPTLVRLIKR